LIPVPSSPELQSAYAERVHSGLLPGSPTDIDPARYGQAPHPKHGRRFPERDAAGMTLLELADERALPVLGRRFGPQILSVHRRGSLVQDIPSQVPGALAHGRPGAPREVKAHRVRIDPGSRLARLLGASEIEVNSFHHQAAAQPGRDLQVAATAPDGVIE